MKAEGGLGGGLSSSPGERAVAMGMQNPACLLLRPQEPPPPPP